MKVLQSALRKEWKQNEETAMERSFRSVCRSMVCGLLECCTSGSKGCTSEGKGQLRSQRVSVSHVRQWHSRRHADYLDTKFDFLFEDLLSRERENSINYSVCTSGSCVDAFDRENY
jgi:hypothetical protein